MALIRKVKSSQGFTLVEVLVTSAILGVLALIASELIGSIFGSLSRAKMHAEVEDRFNQIRAALMSPESCRQVVRMQGNCFTLNNPNTVCGANCVNLGSGSTPFSPPFNVNRLCDRNGNVIFAVGQAADPIYRITPNRIQLQVMSPAMPETGGFHYLVRLDIGFQNHPEYGSIAPKQFHFQMKVPWVGPPLPGPAGPPAINQGRGAFCYNYQSIDSCGGVIGTTNDPTTGKCVTTSGPLAAPLDGWCNMGSPFNDGVAACSVGPVFYAFRPVAGAGSQLRLVRTCTLKCQYNP